MRLKDKVAVITGGARGIGEASARLFVKNGAKVVIADLNEKLGNNLAEELGDCAAFYRVDVSKSDEVGKLFEFVDEKFGGLDILFNNAGISCAKSLEDTTEEDWDRTMNVNLKGYFLCSKYALPLLKKRKNSVILNTGSELAFVVCKESLAYNATKGGIIQLTKSMALELAEYGIRVNAVCPSGTETPLFKEDMSRSGNYEKEVARLVSTYPMKRLAQPEDVANAALFLVSDESSFITGFPLLVDGGFTIQ